MSSRQVPIIHLGIAFVFALVFAVGTPAGASGQDAPTYPPRPSWMPTGPWTWTA